MHAMQVQLKPVIYELKDINQLDTYGPLSFCYIKISLRNPELSKRILLTLLANKASIKANK